MHWLKRLGAGAAVLLLLAAGGAWFAVRRQLPDEAAAPIAGLRGEVTVAVDGRGVPTLKAAELFDAFRVQGFETARERMFQMELMRRSAEGRLSELVGAGALPLDRIHRTYGFREVAAAAVPLLPAEERQALEAYAAGVNAYLASRPGRWGLEFQMLGLRPEPWTPAHSLEVLLLMHEDLSTSWKAEIQAEALKGLPEATQRFLMPVIAEGDLPLTPDLPGTVPDTAAFFGGGAVASSPAAKAAALRDLEATQAIPTPDPELRAGSNNWVIAGSRTKSGKPILANDPHLNLGAPGIWFQVRFEVGGRGAQGVSLPGLPGIVIGHNDAVAWGFTNLGTDVQDLYREKATSERVESIPVKGKPAEELRVKLGAHGPQVLPGLSLHWTALDPALLRLPTMGFMQAKDWASFNAAVDQFTGPAQNIVYADTAGHIGWRASGLIPIRKKGKDGSRILDGSDPSHDWQGFVPQSEMPRVFDPPQGFLATANNRVVGTSFPHLVATEWAGTSRARQIAATLETGNEFDPGLVSKVQLDRFGKFIHEFGSCVPEAVYVGGFRAETQSSKPDPWDREPDPSWKEMSRLDAFRRVFRKKLLEGRLLGSTLQPTKFRWYNEDAWLLAAAKATPEQWKATGLGDKQAFLDACMKEAQSSPTWNKPWGEVNEVRMKHPFGLGGGILGWIFNPKPARLSGSTKSIRVVSRDFGQSMRMVVDLADLDATRLVLPLGESGHLGSAHRLDQFGDWQKGDEEGQRTRLKQGAVRTRVFRPS
ncbi:MAG: penicillin acylase family protein [Holophagaceae bacterium]